MRRQRIAQFLALALFAVLPAAAQAQQSQIRGTWTLNRGQSDDINAKINTTVARMNVVVRQIARPRLRSTNTAYPQLVINYDQQNIRVDMQGRPSVSSPGNGQPVLWHRETGRTCPQVRGDCVRVTTEWEDGRLEQTFAAEDGQRVNVYTVSADGNTLTMNVTITSPRLPQPLTYRLVYNRAS
jgi:flagellar hook-associated protein FlgK